MSQQRNIVRILIGSSKDKPHRVRTKLKRNVSKILAHAEGWQLPLYTHRFCGFQAKQLFAVQEVLPIPTHFSVQRGLSVCRIWLPCLSRSTDAIWRLWSRMKVGITFAATRRIQMKNDSAFYQITFVIIMHKRGCIQSVKMN